MSVNVSSRIGTDTALISSLITGIKKGETKIPQFQRQFVWKDEQALDLLDSIARNYPVGSLLLWRTKDKLRTERDIGEFQLPVTDDMSPTDYVLDGQQRLTVIYSCLGAAEEDGGFAVVYDLQEQAFLRLSDNLKLHQFPLRKLFDTTRLLNYRTALQAALPAYQPRLDELISAFNDYRIPVVTLKDLTVEQVCPIFERINSSGTKLSTYDLMVAATWNKDFDLNNEVDEIQTALGPKGFEDIDRTTVLKCLSAVQLGTVKEDSLKTLRDMDKSDMRALIDKTKHALLKTVDLLSTEFRLYSSDFVSYEALLIVMAHIFADIQHLTPDQVTRVRQWFWRASFSERYRAGGENFVSKDLSAVHEFVVNGSGLPSDFGNPLTDREWMSVPFRSNVSRTRAYILALAVRGPRNITNGSRIDSSVALSSYNKKEFHHVYPRAHLKRQGIVKDDNLLINISMLAAAANKEISDKDPNVYLPDCITKLGSTADTVFASNLLPPPSTFDYSTASYSDFLAARLTIVEKFVGELCDGYVHP